MSKVDELKRVPLFGPLSQRQLARLGRQVGEREYASGAVVIREGERNAVTFFIVADGEATVTVGGRQVRTLGPGDHFGELAQCDGDGDDAASLPRAPVLELPLLRS
jgi:CRP/FNR family transcriptional regulator, cyclic AMP receptor protein